MGVNQEGTNLERLSQGMVHHQMEVVAIEITRGVMEVKTVEIEEEEEGIIRDMEEGKVVVAVEVDMVKIAEIDGEDKDQIEVTEGDKMTEEDQEEVMEEEVVREVVTVVVAVEMRLLLGQIMCR